MGSFGYYAHEFKTALNLVKTKKINLIDMVTDIYSLEEVNEAFARQMDSDNSVKVCFKC